MKTFCSRYLLFVALLFSGILYSNEFKTKKWLAQKEWSQFVKLLGVYQTRSPGAFVPIEWVPVSALDETELKNLVGTFVKKSLQISKEKQEDLELLSLQANEQFRQLVAKAKALPTAENILLANLDPQFRKSLTPLDEVFKGSELGRKIAKDLAKYPEYEVSKVTADTKQKKLVYWARKRSEYNNDFFNVPAQPFYILEVHDSANSAQGELILKGRFVDSAKGLTEDLKFSKTFLKGSFFGSASGQDSILGPLPKTNRVFVDESGVSHFAGDGHKH
jgi:hypothetical protein